MRHFNMQNIEGLSMFKGLILLFLFYSDYHHFVQFSKIKGNFIFV